MPQVICPRCATVSDTRAPGYPFCTGCQENLAKCGYCRWFATDTGLCAHPIVSGVFEVSDSATPPCVYHDPADRLLPRRRLLRFALWAAAFASIAILSLGLARMGSRPPALPEQADLGLVMEASYEGAVVGKQYTVRAVVFNSSDRPATGARLEIAQRTLEAFSLVSVRPSGGEPATQGRWTVVSRLALGAGESRPVDIELKPKRTGTLHVMVRLVSSGNVFHGLADLPVIVEENGGATPGSADSRPAAPSQPEVAPAKEAKRR
ncbi:MAG: hypothetical protein ACE149_07835 [Armatimonadota bacterium]